ncbi:MAG TPA: hypothetical protein VEZ11_00500 [Thermoanaerobaculia bacterium]|nr:hypothetical protein [Thermoanaerobaculia bacterium]
MTPAMNPDVRVDRQLVTGIGRFQKPTLITGIAFALISLIGLLFDAPSFYRSWLPSWLFWLQINAGCLAILFLQYISGGQWGIVIRRPLGAAARSMPVLALLFIPLLASVWLRSGAVYPWADPAVAGADAVMIQKARYLNPTFWTLRALFFFLCWIVWAWRVKAVSRAFEASKDPYLELSRRKWSSTGLLMIVMTLTFCSVDWLMSVEPKWFSTMFGISFTIGCGLSALAFVTLIMARLSTTKAVADVVKPSHLRDLGNLMLAFTMLWAYTAFSEFLLVWYANIKEEIPYFIKREHGGWGVIAASLVLFHFFLPFFMLLMRSIKDRPRTIAIVSAIVLVMRYVNLYWLAAPAFHPEFHYSWMSLTSLIGIGGLWLWFFIGQLKGQTIIPIYETWVEEALREGAVKTHA